MDFVFALKTGVDANLEPPGGGMVDVGESKADPVEDAVEPIEGMPDRRLTTVDGPTSFPPLLFLTLGGDAGPFPADLTALPLSASPPPPPPSSSSFVKVPSLFIVGGFPTSSLFNFKDPTAFIGAAFPAPVDLMPDLIPDLAAGTPIADFPPGAADDFNAIFDGAKVEVRGGGTAGLDDEDAAAEVETCDDEADLFMPGEGSLGGRPEADDDRAAVADGEASRRPPVGGGFPVAAVTPPVDARLGLGGGRRLLPARVGFEDGPFDAVAEVDVGAATPVLSRGPSAVFFLERGA